MNMVREILAERLRPLRENRRVGVDALRRFLAEVTQDGPEAPRCLVVRLPDGVEWAHVRAAAAELLTAPDPDGVLTAFAPVEGDPLAYRLG